MYLRALDTNRVDLLPRGVVVVVALDPSVKTFLLMSNLNFLWSSCKPFPNILSDTRKKRSAHPSTLSFWGSCRQPWSHPSVYFSLSWTDQIFSAIHRKWCPPVLSLYFLFFSLLWTCSNVKTSFLHYRAPNCTQYLRWGCTNAENSRTTTLSSWLCRA